MMGLENIPLWLDRYRPKKRWVFAGALPTGMSFSRAGNATRVDETGTLCWAPANMVSFSNDMRITAEAGETRLWTASSGMPEATYDGSATTVTWGADVQYRRHTLPNYQSGSKITVQGKLKQGTYTGLVDIYLGDGPSTNRAKIRMNLGTGQITATYPAGTGVIHAYGIEPAEDGYYFVWATLSIIASLPIYMYINNTTGTGTTLCKNWQVENTSYNSPQPYIETSGSAYYAPRFDYDPVTLQPRGLLVEESRTNRLTRSWRISVWTNNYVTSITDNAALAPDGSMGATVLETATSNKGRYILTSGLNVDTSYAVSGFIKAISGAGQIVKVGAESVEGGSANGHLIINMATGAITSYGTKTYDRYAVLLPSGWVYYSYRVITGPAQTAFAYTAYSYSADCTFSIWGAQVEACGSSGVASSHIPTDGTAGTRAAETCTGVVGPEFNPAQGTLVATAMVPYSVPTNKAYLVGVSDGTLNHNGILNIIETNGKPLGGNVINDIVSLSGGSLNGVEPYVPFTNIVAYKSGTNIVSSGGVTDTAGAFGPKGIPYGLAQYNFGGSVIANRNLNGWLQSVEIYPFAFNSALANRESV